MKKENCFTDRLKENKRVVIKNKCHSKPRPLPLGRAPQGRNAGSDDGALESHRFLKRQQGEILNQVQDDGPVYYNNKAFTLIELLVVVLIIGILAAVAVPQYRLAVAKSRFIEVKNIVDKITQAQEVYYLANGKYSNRFEELDIDLPTGGQIDNNSANRYNYSWGSCFTGNVGQSARTCCYNEKIGLGYLRRPEHILANPNGRQCAVLTSNTSNWKNQICKQETGRTSGILSEGYLWWNY